MEITRAIELMNGIAERLTVSLDRDRGSRLRKNQIAIIQPVLAELPRVIEYLQRNHPNMVKPLKTNHKALLACSRESDRVFLADDISLTTEERNMKFRHYQQRLATALKDTAEELQQAKDLVKPNWTEQAPEYMASSKAVEFATFVNRKISSSQLSKLLRPDGPIRYMRKTKPFRCRVHIGDFREYIKDLPKLKVDGSDISDEDVEEYLADAAAQKLQAKEQQLQKKEPRKSKSGLEKLAKKIRT